MKRLYEDSGASPASEEEYIPEYAIIITSSGHSRGFVVKAPDKKAALDRLMEKMGEHNVLHIDNIQISEILLDSDFLL